jgi:hypothetical protein
VFVGRRICLAINFSPTQQQDIRMKSANSKTAAAAKTALVALGFRTHSGWAAVVAVARSVNAIQVIDRRRIELADPAIPGSVQPYHAAEGMDPKPAQAHITRCINSTGKLAHRAIKSLLDDLSQSAHTVVGAGILLASGRPLPGVAAILKSHALIHTAEGELYRDAIIQTSNRLKIPVTAIKERELFEHGAAQLGISVDALQRKLNDLGRTIGPPWQQDQKYATAVAWLALKAASG